MCVFSIPCESALCCFPPERPENVPVTSKPWGCSGSRFPGHQDGVFYTLRRAWSSAETGEPGDSSPMPRAFSCRSAGLTIWSRSKTTDAEASHRW
jgi:hypothetical protein